MQSFMIQAQDCEGVNNKRVRPQPIKTKQDWHDRFRNLRLGKKGAEDSGKPESSTMAYAIFDDNLYMMNEREFSHSNVSQISYIYFFDFSTSLSGK